MQFSFRIKAAGQLFPPAEKQQEKMGNQLLPPLKMRNQLFHSEACVAAL